MKKFNPYRNLFYYYRGPTSKHVHLEKQLEDNTTKALVNTLEFSSNSILVSFLSTINIPIKDKSSPQYDLQVATDFGRPDALIKLGKTNIFIECKIDASLERKQINNHLRSIDNAYLVCITPREKDEQIIKSIKNTKLRFITWQNIYEVFSQFLIKNKNEDNLIVQQFVKYLENINMATFNGFQKDDFDSFLYIDDDPKREIRNIVKDKFRKYLDELYNEVNKQKGFKNLKVDVGNLNKDSTGVRGAMYPKNIKSVVQAPHYQFVLQRNRFQLGIMIEGKIPANKILNRIQTNTNEFCKILKGLDGFTFEIHKKVNIDNLPRKFKAYPVATLKLGEEITLDDVFYIMNKTKQYKLFVFYCYTPIPRDNKNLNSKKFIKHSVKLLNKIKPYYEFSIS